MPKFINTRTIDTVDSITTSYKKRLESPFNVLSDQKPFITNYFNQNVENTTLDEATRTEYSPTGDMSPIRFNKITDAVLFGGSQLQLDLDVGDFGLSSNEITGELTVMPNTFTPYPGDFFSIKHLGHKYIFKVTNVNMDTMPNGSNYHRIAFEYDHLDEDGKLDKQVINRYRMLVNNVGTEYTSVIKEEIYDAIDNIEIASYNLKKFYYACFFKEKLQNFVYEFNGSYFYDPYMIEFLKRNDIYSDEDMFVAIYHELPLAATFPIDYDGTFLRRVEECNINKPINLSAIGKLITNKASIFLTRYEKYFEIRYNDATMAQSVPTVDVDLVNRCKSGEFYDADSYDSYKNIIIKYFQKIQYNAKDIEAISNINVMDNIELFYNIPIIIHIFNRFKADQIKRN